MFDPELYKRFDQTVARENTECEKWDDRASFGSACALPMWVADMDFETVPEVIASLRERVQHGVFGYSMPTGRDKDALINWLKRRHAADVCAEDVLFSPGVVDSIYHALVALFAPGSKIVVQPPVYGPFFSMPKKAGMQLIENPLIDTDGVWRMDLNGLEDIFKSGADGLVLCSPHNPVGRIWTREELRELGSLCKKYGVTIVSDEIHSDFELDGQKHSCILSVPGCEGAVQLVSATKTFNLAALRHSSIVCRDADKRQKIASQLERAMADVNLFGRLATRIAYESGENWLDTLLVYLRENRDLMYEALKATGKLRPVSMEGTYLMWVDCRALGMKNEALMDFFVQKAGIIPSGGTFFGSQGDGFVRLNLATQRARVAEAADKIYKALKAL